jgi:hypothetical protein
MLSDLDNKLSDQFYRSSKQGWERQMEERRKFLRKSQWAPVRTCQSPLEPICVTCYKEKYFEKLAFFRSQKRVFTHHKNKTNY